MTTVVQQNAKGRLANASILNEKNRLFKLQYFAFQLLQNRARTCKKQTVKTCYHIPFPPVICMSVVNFKLTTYKVEDNQVERPTDTKSKF